jgi:hypothetical protein
VVDDGTSLSAPAVVSLTVATFVAPQPADSDPTGSGSDEDSVDESSQPLAIASLPESPTSEAENAQPQAAQSAAPSQRTRAAGGLVGQLRSTEVAADPADELVAGSVSEYASQPTVVIGLAPRSLSPEVSTAAHRSRSGTDPTSSFVLASGSLFSQLDSLIDELENHQYSFELIVGTAILTSGAVSVGFVVWASRAGYFLTMLSTSLPAWAVVDPIPVLDEEALAKRSEKRVARRYDKSLADLVYERQVSVSVQFLDEQLQVLGPDAVAVTRDISENGIGLVCDAPIVSQFIRLRLTTPRGQEMDVLGSVRHCAPDGEKHHVGVQIVSDWQKAIAGLPV